MAKTYGQVKGPYRQRSIRERIEALFLDNLGKVIKREQILEVARDPETSKAPENWHQRLSELRTDLGYTIHSWRDNKDLKVSEYLMPTAERRPDTARRVQINPETWLAILERSGNRCEWIEGGQSCGLREGEVDSVGGGTVRLTPDHKRPHSVGSETSPIDMEAWQALCGRHQVMKKNYWDDSTGWINVIAIVQAASVKVKREVYEFLRRFFGD